RLLSLHNDSVIASFSGEDRLEFSIYALKAAQQIQREFEPIGERWQNDYALPAAVALGLHVGDTVFGMAGPDDSQEYVAFGDCVSIAERLVHRARAGEIVLSLAFMRAIGATVKTLGAEVSAFFEVGAEKVVDHRQADALALSELDQAVRSEGVGRAHHARERELDALALTLRGNARIELPPTLDRTEFRLAILRARHPALRHLGIQLEGPVANAHLRFVAQKRERFFKAPLADVAPRANDVGNHLDGQGLSHYCFFAGIVQR